MRQTAIVAFALILPCLHAPAYAANAEQTDYVAGMEDVPLMPGLKANPSATTYFDQPEGRIVETTANGVVDPGRVAQYYGTTLPQLGWKPQPNGQYAREGESLEIAVQPYGAGSTVRFTVAPYAASYR